MNNIDQRTYPNIDVLQADLSTCRLCVEGGYQIESMSVFSGRQTDRVMLVGQAPGVEEIESRRPFSGDAGRRLFRWLKRAGWEEEEFRSSVTISAVTRCFPGRNPKGDGDRVPSAAERKLCARWLEGELSLVSPEMVIPVGSLAINLFYPERVKLVDVIGTVYEDENGRLILPLPHPSGASRWHNDPRNVGRIDLALFHLRRLKGELGL